MRGITENVESMFIYLRLVRSCTVIPLKNTIGKGYLCNPRTQKRPHKEFESFKLGLNNNESEIRLGVGVAGLQLHQLDLGRRRAKSVIIEEVFLDWS